MYACQASLDLGTEMEDVRMYHHLAIFAFECREGSFCTDYTPLLSFYPDDKAGYQFNIPEAIDRIVRVKTTRKSRMLSQPRPNMTRYVADCFRNDVVHRNQTYPTLRLLYALYFTSCSTGNIFLPRPQATFEIISRSYCNGFRGK